MVSGDDVDDSDVVGIVASDIDDDMADRQEEKATTSGGGGDDGVNAIVIIGIARRIMRNDNVVRTLIRLVAHVILHASPQLSPLPAPRHTRFFSLPREKLEITRMLATLCVTLYHLLRTSRAQQKMMKTSKLHAACCHSAAILLLFACLQLCNAFCHSKGVTDASNNRQYSLLSFTTVSNKSWQCNPSSRRIPPKITHVYSSISSSVTDYINSDDSNTKTTSRSKQITGFSFTTLRTTLRAATGISLTALRISIRAATGISLSGIISGTNRRMLEILSPSLRYFFQPFLILYYAPLLMVRYWLVGPSRQYVDESWNGHKRIVDGWRKAVEAAEKASADGYRPVHLNGK